MEFDVQVDTLHANRLCAMHIVLLNDLNRAISRYGSHLPRAISPSSHFPVHMASRFPDRPVSDWAKPSDLVIPQQPQLHPQQVQELFIPQMQVASVPPLPVSFSEMIPQSDEQHEVSAGCEGRKIVTGVYVPFFGNRLTFCHWIFSSDCLAFFSFLLVSQALAYASSFQAESGLSQAAVAAAFQQQQFQQQQQLQQQQQQQQRLLDSLPFSSAFAPLDIDGRVLQQQQQAGGAALTDIQLPEAAGAPFCSSWR